MESLQNYNTIQRKSDDHFDITGKKIASNLRNVDQEQLSPHRRKSNFRKHLLCKAEKIK